MIDRAKGLLADLDDWSLSHRIPRVSRGAVSGFMNHEALQYAGSMAYFAVLSVFQLLVLGVVLGSIFLGEGEARSFIIEQVERWFAARRRHGRRRSSTRSSSLAAA